MDESPQPAMDLTSAGPGPAPPRRRLGPGPPFVVFQPGLADAGAQGALDAEPTCGGLSAGTHHLPVSEVPNPTDREPVAVNPRP
jgi:hypothetical protein